MPPEPPTAPTRRWYRLHWVTWLFVIVEIGALGYCQWVPQLAWIYGSVYTYEMTNHGWPLCEIEEIGSGVWGGPLPMDYEYTYFIPSLIINVLFWLYLLTSIAFVVEMRMRRSKRWQFSLMDLLKLTAVVAVVLTLVVRRGEIYEALWGAALKPSLALERVIFMSPIFQRYAHLIWSISVILILFGLGCEIYTLGSFASFATRRLWSFTRPAANDNNESPT